MASIFDRSLKGVYTPHYKNTREMETEVMPVPDEVYIVMSQHMGQPCDVLVQPRDTVKVGQVLGDSEAVVSAPIHSSVSGTVRDITEIIMPNGIRSKAVIIKSNGKQELDPELRPPHIRSREDFIQAVHTSGLVGLGGAGFPTYIKYSPRTPGKIDTLIINAAECEPYITSDYRTMIETPADVLVGIRATMKHIGIPKCIIGIEDNKPKAIKLMRETTKDDGAIRVTQLRSKYPQGAEKVLIYETTGRVVPEGKLPSDVNVIVSNVTTIAFLAQYLRNGIPLVNKRITVDGGAVANPKNVLVPIGTPIRQVIKFCGGYKKEPRKILMGGPMMGTAVYDEDYPVIKNNNAILAFDREQVEDYDETACIRCGRCVRGCPVNLMPLRIEDAFLREDMDDLMRYKVNLCMECGCCSYVCPAKRHLVHTNRLAKAKLRAAAANQ